MKPKLQTYSFAILLLTATSFSTVRSSNVCGVKANLRRTLLQMGHGAGPSVNSLSIHDSHLQITSARTPCHRREYRLTFYGNMSWPAGAASDSNICHSCIQDIGHPLTALCVRKTFRAQKDEYTYEELWGPSRGIFDATTEHGWRGTLHSLWCRCTRMRVGRHRATFAHCFALQPASHPVCHVAGRVERLKAWSRWIWPKPLWWTGARWQCSLK